MIDQADHYFGARLLAWRKSRNLSQQLAARRLGVAATTWSHWETGRRLPGARMLMLLAELTGMSLGQMLCQHGDTCPRARGELYLK
jgi:transcriptional regulator with XRE-family HTH domain